MQSNYINSTRMVKLKGPNKQEFLHEIQVRTLFSFAKRAQLTLGIIHIEGQNDKL